MDLGEPVQGLSNSVRVHRTSDSIGSLCPSGDSLGVGGVAWGETIIQFWIKLMTS